MGNQKSIVLVSCVKTKRNHSCKASDMYVSSLFKKMMAYAVSLKPDQIYILSAKYGLLKPDDMIDPYEKTLKNMRSDEKKIWAESVLLRLRSLADLEQDSFVFLAGNEYRKNIVPYIRNVSTPMEKLPFGRQLQWLEENIR